MQNIESDKINVRRATIEDMPRIIDLLNQVLMVHHNGRPDLFKGNCRKYNDSELQNIIADDNTPVFVGVDNNNYVWGYSFCIFKQYPDDNILTDIKTLYIDDLCVEEAARGMHVGRKIYEYVIDYAKRSGCYNVTLNVWSCNPSAQKFYENVGLMPQKIGMEKIL